MPTKNTSQSAVAWNTLSGNPPIIIAHRGASGVLPEHTIEAYDRAIELGADYIEPDLVLTKDGHLVARHDRYLSQTTDISAHPEFMDRKVIKEGHEDADWFVEDFTLAEIQSLRARQPRTGRSKAYDGEYKIPTFEEILALITKRSDELGRPIGVYPETKQPAFFESQGLSFDDALLDTLAEYGFDEASDSVFIQSFEAGNLKRLRGKTDIRLVYLIGDIPQITMDEIAKFADGIGPYKKLLIQDGQDTGFVRAAHSAGLAVHPWTFRDDDVDAAFGSIDDEAAAYFELGIDGAFFDFPDTGLALRDSHAIIKSNSPKN